MELVVVGAPGSGTRSVGRAFAERRAAQFIDLTGDPIVALSPPADGVLLRYVNRLSDLLFAMARAVNHQAGASETEW